MVNSKNWHQRGRHMGNNWWEASKTMPGFTAVFSLHRRGGKQQIKMNGVLEQQSPVA